MRKDKIYELNKVDELSSMQKKCDNLKDHVESR